MKPDFYTVMVPDPYTARLSEVYAAPIASPPAWAGRWPVDCDHRALLQVPPDQLLADARCQVCRWPWWVIRASLTE